MKRITLFAMKSGMCLVWVMLQQVHKIHSCMVVM